MSRGRTPFPHGLLLGLVATLTTWAALTSWHSLLVRSADYLAPLLVCGAIIAVTGAALRRFALPSYAVVAAQAVLATGFVVDHLVGTIAPTGKTLRAVGAVLDSAVTSARTYAAPIGVDVPSIAPLLIVSGAVFLLVVDVLACTLHRIPIAGLALLAVYTIPAGLTESGPGWLAFLGAATGFLVLLHLDTRDQLMRWGRPLGPPESSGWSDANPLTDAVRAGAGRIGLMAVALALVVPTFLPVLDLELLGLGPGDGDDEIRIRKPIADMRRDLERGLDIPLLRIETDDPDPDYLRISVLNRFTGVEWSSGDRDVAGEDRADGALPEPDGLSPDVPRSTYDYDIDINDDFDSTWLPTQFPATEVRADGDWRFDRDTMDFLAVGDDLTTADLSYSLTAIDPDYGTTGEYFRNATTDDVDDEVLDVPGGLPSEVRSYAQSVTSGARNDYERALLLQRWFRRDGGFRYNVNKAPAGTGGSTFETFLNPVEGGRVGYCEQFASAMAIMARTLGIPARVAVGFLRPDPVGDDDGLLGVQLARPARLARALLRRRRMGAVRADAVPACPDRSRLRPRPRTRCRPGRPDRHRRRRTHAQHRTGPAVDRRADQPGGSGREGRQERVRRRRRWPAHVADRPGHHRAGAGRARRSRPRTPGGPGARTTPPARRRSRGRVGRAARDRDRPRRAVAGRPLAAPGRGGAARAPRRPRRPLSPGAPAPRRGRRPRRRGSPAPDRGPDRADPLRPAGLRRRRAVGRPHRRRHPVRGCARGGRAAAYPQPGGVVPAVAGARPRRDGRVRPGAGGRRPLSRPVSGPTVQKPPLSRRLRQRSSTRSMKEPDVR